MDLNKITQERQFIYQRMANNINLEEFKTIFEHLVKNNKRLMEEGKKPSTISITGDCGIGKTDCVRQIAKENGMTFVKLNLSQLEEVGDLCGFPLKEFKIIEKHGDEIIEKWIPHDLLQVYMQRPCEDYEITNESRMSYAAPEWLPREENPNGTILFLDDFNRCAKIFVSASMELINEFTYIGWHLPKGTQVVLSRNPDNGTYDVSPEDVATKTRYIDFNVDFDLSCWARWAEQYGLEGRGINFALSYGHEIFKNDGVNAVNARSYTTFVNAISGIEDWSKPEALAMILNIAKGCFPDKDNIIGHLFTTFIANKLDKLISPEDMLMKAWTAIKPQIRKCVYDDSGMYRPDVASVLHTRLLNYSIYYFNQKGAKTDVVQDRLLELIDACDDKEGKLFDEDLLFNIIRTLMKQFPTRTNKFMLNRKIREKVK